MTNFIQLTKEGKKKKWKHSECDRTLMYWIYLMHSCLWCIRSFGHSLFVWFTCHCRLVRRHLLVQPNWCSVIHLWCRTFYNEYNFVRWFVVSYCRLLHLVRIHRHRLDKIVLQAHRKLLNFYRLVLYHFLVLNELVGHLLVEKKKIRRKMDWCEMSFSSCTFYSTNLHDLFQSMQQMTVDQMWFYYQAWDIQLACIDRLVSIACNRDHRVIVSMVLGHP